MAIYWVCPKPRAPSGGVWFIHHLAQMLNLAGMESYVVQTEPFHVWWDANPVDPKIIRGVQDPLESDGIVVVPDILWPPATKYPGKLMVFLQNYVWLRDSHTPLENVLVCSRFLANWLERERDLKPVGKLTPYLSDGVWENEGGHSDRRVLVIARRNDFHSELAVRLAEDGLEVVYVREAVSQVELARLLARCGFYVHLNSPEGFPMACLEAMRAGTTVVGTTGGGGNEFMFHRETAMVVQDPGVVGDGDRRRFIDEIIDSVKTLRSSPSLTSRIRSQALEWSLRYTPGNTLRELEDVFIGSL